MIDTSALLAVLFDEAERAAFVRRIAADRHGDEGARDLKLFLIEAAIRLVPVTVEQAERARAAYRRFGRGNHPARLNYGDCFAYALARNSGEPLLFKGGDFGQTDVEAA